MKSYDFRLPSEQMARKFITQSWVQHPEDVSFFRSGCDVRVFDGSGPGVESSIRQIYDTIVQEKKPGPQMTRRVTPLQIQVPNLTISPLDD